MGFVFSGRVAGSIELWSPTALDLARALETAGFAWHESHLLALELMRGVGAAPTRSLGEGVTVERTIERRRRVYTVRWDRKIDLQGKPRRTPPAPRPKHDDPGRPLGGAPAKEDLGYEAG